MKVWKVDVSVTVYVVALDEDEAGEAAEKGAAAQLRDGGATTLELNRVARLANVETGWRRAIPYGAPWGDDRSVEQHLVDGDER